MFGLTCFERHHAHHQKLTTVLAASGLPLERGGSSAVGRGLPDHDPQGRSGQMHKLSPPP
jgi:hypothetical protein